MSHPPLQNFVQWPPLPPDTPGKRDLPAQMRNRFTELWVPEPSAPADLAVLVGSYLAGAAPQPPVEAVVQLYLATKAEAVSTCCTAGCFMSCVGALLLS